MRPPFMRCATVIKITSARRLETGSECRDSRHARQAPVHARGDPGGTAARASRRPDARAVTARAGAVSRAALARNRCGAQASLPIQAAPPVKRPFRIESLHAAPSFSRSGSPPRSYDPNGSRGQVRGLSGGHAVTSSRTFALSKDLSRSSAKRRALLSFDRSLRNVKALNISLS